MFDVLHFRARCKDRQKVKGGDGQRKEKGSKRQIQPFLTKSMSLKTMTTKPCWICSISEVCLHLAYSPARAQFMFSIEVVFLYQ